MSEVLPANSMVADAGTARSARRPGQLGLRVSLGVLALISMIAVAAPLLPLIDPLQQDLGSTLSGPSLAHWFGTDELGRDILSRIMYGARPSIVTALGAALVAGTVGTSLGMVAGYFGRWIDSALMRVMDVLLAVPAVLLALVVIVTINPGATSAMIAVAVVGVPQFARLSRSQALSLRSREFVLASRAMGASSARIIFRVILPNSAGPLIAQAVVLAALAVFLEAALSFLGLGVPPPYPSWGQMVSAGRSFLQVAPGYSLFPGITIAVTILALDVVAGHLRSRFAGEHVDLADVVTKAA